ncbi:MAG: hypothetical protein U1E65_02750 [Myxococcota bacterium]
MDGVVYQDYHPMAVRLWGSVVVNDKGRPQLPEEMKRAALLMIRRTVGYNELAWIYGSVYSLYAAMMQKGEQRAANAFLLIALEAKKQGISIRDSVRRVERGTYQKPPEPAPDLVERAEPKQPLSAVLSLQLRRA